MARHLDSSWACVAVACAVTAVARPARAEPGDGAALKLRAQAIYTDYLATSFQDASDKLQKALAQCKAPTECSAAVRARLMCDLGVMAFMLQRADEGRADFAAALKEDPSVALDNDLSSEELARELAAVKGQEPAPSPAVRSGIAAATDCPPAFPGCHSSSRSTACVSDDECTTGQSCVQGACTESSAPSSPVEHAAYKRNWLSVAFQADALLMPSASNACAGGTGYTCFGSDGSYDADLPLSGADDQVNGGLTLATSRVLFGYDRALGENVTVGARLGYALGGGPQRPTASSFLPVHVEARVAYFLGNDPLARAGFRFFVLGAGGMAQVDASVPVDVYASLQAYQNQQSQDYRAWKKTGLAFAALGGGTMFAITPSTGVALEAKAMEMFPTAATGFSLQLGYVVGL